MNLSENLPLALALLFAGFLSIFAADVFEARPVSWALIIPLLIHLIPSFLIVALGFLGRRFPLAAAIAFVTLGLGYMAATTGRFPIMTQAIIGGPPILIGVLYITQFLNRERKKEKHP